MLTSVVPVLHFSFPRWASCTPSCTFSFRIPCQWKATGLSKVGVAATQWEDALSGVLSITVESSCVECRDANMNP